MTINMINYRTGRSLRVPKTLNNYVFEICKYSHKERIKDSALKNCKDVFDQIRTLNLIMIFTDYERTKQAIKNTFPKNSAHQILVGIELLRKEQYENMKNQGVTYRFFLDCRLKKYKREENQKTSHKLK